MNSDDVNFTGRVLRVIWLAEEEVETTNCTFLNPLHLFIGCLKESTGALGEVFIKCDINMNYLRNISNKVESNSIQSLNDYDKFNVPISVEVEKVFEEAARYMRRFNQVYLNEGHILKALITSSVLNNYLSEENKNIILNTATTPRDMITSLKEYNFPKEQYKNIRKVKQDDFNQLIEFIEKNFSANWLNTIKNAINTGTAPIYIAFDDKDEIIGFAAYDVVRGKKGLFGPMGVTLNNRIKGVGYSLLHQCLKDMKENGYEYAIIDEAGPQEFYEKACNATLIQIN